MELKVILLADEENSVHPRNLPWKDEYEPWILICKNNSYHLYHTDSYQDMKKSEFLLNRILKQIFPDVQKERIEYARKHHYVDYKNLKQAIKKFVEGSQGSLLKIEFSPDLNNSTTITTEKVNNLDDIFSLVKKSYAK